MKDNVFVFDSPYTLLLYCVLYPDNIFNTIYIHSNNNALNRLDFGNKRHIVINKGRGKVEKILLYVFFKLRTIFDKKLRYIFRHPKEFYFYGQDHLFFSAPFVHDFVLIEDGLANYKIPDYSKLYKFFLGEKTFGRSEKVKKIFLSGMMKIKEPEILNKVEYFDLLVRWNSLTPEQKNNVNKFFRFTNTDEIEADVVILTQPLSEYGFITESEKINIYQKLISEYDGHNVVIRRHPREMTCYPDYFPNVKVNDSKVPIELILLNSPSIRRGVTLFSSGIFNLPCQYKDFKGTSYHPLLLQKFGKINP